MTLKLTIDTNVVQEYWRRQAKLRHVERLLDRAKDGEFEVAVTGRIRDDIQTGPLAAKFGELPELGIDETGSIFRLDMSITDGPDVTGSAEFDVFHAVASRLAEQRVGKRRVPDWRDWDHLHAHHVHGRDIFLTWDKGILCLAPELKKNFGLVVMTPEDFLTQRAGG